jgi:hypothetical protein
MAHLASLPCVVRAPRLTLPFPAPHHTTQAAHLLVAALPNYAGQPLVPPARDPTAFAQQLQSDILSAVLPLWGHPRAGKLPPGVLQSLLSVLNVCAQVGGLQTASAHAAAPLVLTSV